MDPGDGAPWWYAAPSPAERAELLAERFGRDHETLEAVLAALEHEVFGAPGKGLHKWSRKHS